MIKRYARAPTLNFGEHYGTPQAINVIRTAINNGTLSYREEVMHAGDRLDIMAGRFYGDGRLWWVIAAASEIGWALQVPPGTVVRVPDLSRVGELVG